MVVHALIGKLQGGNTGCGRQRIAGQGSCLIDGTEWSQQVHHICASADRCQWHTATDNLPEREKIGCPTTFGY